jgi:predicted RNase H-like HicB family nuclease
MNNPWNHPISQLPNLHFLQTYNETVGYKTNKFPFSAVLYLSKLTARQENPMLKPVEHERVVRIHIARLPEGVYLATSDDIQGLVAQGRTVAETLEIARDVARKLIEAQSDLKLPEVNEDFDYPLIIGG